MAEEDGTLSVCLLVDDKQARSWATCHLRVRQLSVLSVPGTLTKAPGVQCERCHTEPGKELRPRASAAVETICSLGQADSTSRSTNFTSPQQFTWRRAGALFSLFSPH